MGRRRYKTLGWTLFTILVIVTEARVRAVEDSSLNLASSSTENEVTEISENDHPHGMIGKPSKFDLDTNRLTMTDEESAYQIESTGMENSTRSTINEESQEEESSSSCGDLRIGEKFADFLDELPKVDVYNITDSVQIVRSETVKPNTETERELGRKPDFFDVLHRYAKQYVVRIKVDPNAITARKGRTFFDGCSTSK